MKSLKPHAWELSTARALQLGFQLFQHGLGVGLPVFDHHVGFGANPCLLIVDFINAYTTVDSPLYAEPVVAAVKETQSLLTIARRHGIQVIFTKVLYNKNTGDGGLFVEKIPILKTLTPGSYESEIVPDLPIKPEDIIITKQYASSFFATPLASTLTAKGIDTIILTGCSTSGCIRATAVDGMQHGFRVIVPESCVGDRAQIPHEANLFDINSKYGDVVNLNKVLNYIETSQTITTKEPENESPRTH